MKKYWRLLVLGIVVLVVVVGLVLINNAAVAKNVPEIPGLAVNYVNTEGQDTYIVANKSGFKWQYYNQQSKKREWKTLEPNKFLSEKNTLKTIITDNDTISLSISGKILPDRTVMKRWPDSQWIPGDTDGKHTEGTELKVGWISVNGGSIDSGEIPVEKGSLYAIWLYFGDAWVEYSFLVNPSGGQDAPNTDSALNSPDQWPGYVETFDAYEYKGVIEASNANQHFLLEDKPLNKPEELVALNYYYTIIGEFDKLYDLCDSESMQISAVNTEKNFNDGRYMQEYVIRQLSTLPLEEFVDRDSQILEMTKRDVEQNKLTEYTFVRYDFTMISPPGQEASAQLSDGEYTFYFLCGKNLADEWKLYECYWE
jgi:hypothetical protein